MTPVIPSAPTPPLIASSHRSSPPESESPGDDEDDSDEDDDDTEVITPPFSPTTSSPPTPSLYSEPNLKRKSLGLVLSSGEDGAISGSRLSLSSIRSRKAKKRRLVISGVAIGDEQAYEAVKDWCKTFGPLRQITRKPNGSLHVNFRDASVAETVCRLLLGVIS
ncbi:hypothetical protein Moror_5726 [Moniliophthora roreri MCA 2997]|uniref:RRM domain-containing protein n=1 Tax=Moniliophthora roreri (strain MCA 2997) TaxID=1381753 RepID=V2X0G9_MONRO|nr:hypothetical protein Moror_5726 [Moniliophthora roreri MCA 2997]